MPGMRRREFVSLFGGAAAWPLAARAQQPAMPTIAYLGPISPEAVAGRLRAFRQGLKEIGHVRFSNRPFGVKRFQTIHQHSVDVAHGLVLLFGIGAKALASWDSKTRRNNLWDGLAVSVTAGPSGHTISPHPSSREGHHSTAQWNSSFLLLD